MLEYFNIQGINTYNNPLEYDGQIITGLNITGNPFGAVSKRPGYGTFLGTLPGRVQSLFSFPSNAGSNIVLLGAAGSQLMYSSMGTASWAQANPGTIAPNAYVGNAIMTQGSVGTSGQTIEYLNIGDGNQQVLCSSDGINFAPGTTGGGSPPVAQYLCPYQNILYTSDGSTSNLQASSPLDPTNWSNSGTSSSTSFTLANIGACQGLFVAGNQLIITKGRGQVFTYDDTTFVDTSTVYGPSSPRSIAQIDDYWFLLNQYGIFGFDGATKTLLSAPIQRHFFNRENTGITAASWGSAPATCHYWDYLVAVGTFTDDFTGRTVNNGIIKYDYQKNQFFDWSFNNPPTALHSYTDYQNTRQLIFGDASGNVFQMNPSKTSDNGASIPTEMVFLFTYAIQSTQFSQTSASAQLGSSFQKKWNWIRLFFNPGDEVNVQFAFSDSLTYQNLTWSESRNTREKGGPNDYWQMSDGVVEIRPPNDEENMPRSRFMFLRIYDDSATSQYTYYGAQIDAEIQLIK
jgi:hypothetical protein